LVHIPGHAGIYGNELADQNEKQHAQVIANQKVPSADVIYISDVQR